MRTSTTSPGLVRWVLFPVLFLAGCGSDESSPQTSDTPVADVGAPGDVGATTDAGASGDVGATTDAGASGDVGAVDDTAVAQDVSLDTAGPDEGPADVPGGVSLAVCVFTPQGCAADLTVAFGDIPVGSEVERLVSIENEGLLAVEFPAVDTGSTHLGLEIRAPGQTDPMPFPVSLGPAETIEVWLSVLPGAAPGPLPVSTLTLLPSADAAVDPIELTLTGVVLGCPAGSDSCDGSWATGCETDTLTSPAHCGECDAACDGTCAGGACTPSSCDSGFWGPTCAPCAVGTPACSGHGQCNDGLAGDGSCQCDTGWEGPLCASDVDDCAVDNGGCHPDALCTDLLNDVECSCLTGSVGDGSACSCVNVLLEPSSELTHVEIGPDGALFAMDAHRQVVRRLEPGGTWTDVVDELGRSTSLAPSGRFVVTQGGGLLVASAFAGPAGDPTSVLYLGGDFWTYWLFIDGDRLDLDLIWDVAALPDGSQVVVVGERPGPTGHPQVVLRSVDLFGAWTDVPGNDDGTLGASYGHPAALELALDGTIYVAYPDKWVRVRSPDGVWSFPGSNLIPYATPHDVTAGGDGTIYVAASDIDVDRSAVWEWAPGAQWGKIFDADGVAFDGQAVSVALDATGTLFAVDASRGLVKRLEPGGVWSEVTDAKGSPGSMGSPTALLAMPDGSLYVADGLAGRVRKRSAEGLWTTVTAAEGSDGGRVEARGLAAGPDGTVYVAHEGGIRALATDGGAYDVVDSNGDLAPPTPSGNRFPLAVALESDGTLYVGGYLGVAVDAPTAYRVWSLAPGGVWTDLDDGEGGVQEFAMLRHVAVGADGAVFVLVDGGTLWKRSPGAGWSLVSVIVQPATSGAFLGLTTGADQALYLSAAFGIWKLPPGGSSWTHYSTLRASEVFAMAPDGGAVFGVFGGDLGEGLRMVGGLGAGGCRQELETACGDDGDCASGRCAAGRCRLLGDICEAPFVVGDLPFIAVGDTSNAVDNYYSTDLTCGGGSHDSPDEVYSFTAPGTASYTVTLDAAYDSSLFVVSGCSGQPECYGNSVAEAPQEVLLQLEANETVFIVVDAGWGGGSGSYTLTVGAACVPQCDNKSCGSDGCGGTCGQCDQADVCDASQQCVLDPACNGFSYVGCCDGDVAKYCDAGVVYAEDCGGGCGWAGNAGYYCGGSGTDPGGLPIACPSCTPDCAGRECGPDGCGGVCGANDCPVGLHCDPRGHCSYPCQDVDECPDPATMVCDPSRDPGSCTTVTCPGEPCGPGADCVGQVADPTVGACYPTCLPYTVGSCPLGTCRPFDFGTSGLCFQAEPGKLDGAPCASTSISTGCAPGLVCAAEDGPAGENVCRATCDFLAADPGCPDGQQCAPAGICYAVAFGDPAAVGTPCFEADGAYCGPTLQALTGACSTGLCRALCRLDAPETCPGGTVCTDSFGVELGTCEPCSEGDPGCQCVPNCDGKACGDDGCGGVCGSCEPGYACRGGLTCVAAGSTVPLDCEDANGHVGCCGSDGAVWWFDTAGGGLQRLFCGATGVCGWDQEAGRYGCSPGAQAGIDPTWTHPLTCGGDLSPATDACVKCKPACSGKSCGPDGCGGSCGHCNFPIETCDPGTGQCQPNAPSTTCDEAVVHPGGVYEGDTSDAANTMATSCSWPYAGGQERVFTYTVPAGAGPHSTLVALVSSETPHTVQIHSGCGPLGPRLSCQASPSFFASWPYVFVQDALAGQAFTIVVEAYTGGVEGPFTLEVGICDDKDGDGFWGGFPECPVVQDCNDNSALFWPFAPEPCDSPDDYNCDGVTTPCAP